MPDDPDLFDPLDPDATVTGVEGVSLQADLPDPPSDANGWHWTGYGDSVLAAVAARRRMLIGNETGIDIVERLRFHAEREYRTPTRTSSALMLEAAVLIEDLRGRS